MLNRVRISRIRVVLVGVLTILLACSLISLAQAPARLPREQTLYKAGLQWGPPTSFNPFAATIAWPIPNEEYIYETLFAFNLVTGKLDPILAESYKWVDRLNLTVTLRK